MKTLRLVIFAFIVAACCDGVSCEPYHVLFKFRLVDKNRKDLVLDLKVPPDSIVLSSRRVLIDTLTHYFNSYVARNVFAIKLDVRLPEFTVTYKDRSTDFTINWDELRNDGCCDQADVISVISSGKKLLADSTSELKPFVIPL